MAKECAHIKHVFPVPIRFDTGSDFLRTSQKAFGVKRVKFTSVWWVCDVVIGQATHGDFVHILVAWCDARDMLDRSTRDLI